MRVASSTAAACLLAMVSAAHAQPPRNVQLVISGGVWASQRITAEIAIDDIQIGKTTTAVFSMKHCESVNVGRSPEPDATIAWSVAVTPTRTSGSTVTLRVTSARLTAKGWESDKPAVHEAEVTLKPGQSHDVENLRPVKGTAIHSSCGDGPAYPGVSIASEAWGSGNPMERRLVQTEMWLIERRPDGGQTSAPLSLRSVPDEETAFYFDRIPGPDRAFIDLSGVITPRLHNGRLQIDMKVMTRTLRETESGGFAGVWAKNFWATADPARDEVVDVALPTLAEKDGPFAGRTFAIRVRAKQLR